MPTLRTALKTVAPLLGIALTAIFLVNAIRDASMLGYAKAAVAALVTIRLLTLLRQDKASAAEGPTSAGGGDKSAKLIAIGLAIGLGAPFILLWLIKSFAR